MRRLFVPAALWILCAGCTGSSLVTSFGEQRSINDLTYDQFTHQRAGKIFEAVLTDSSRIPLRLISAQSDSIRYLSLDSGVHASLPTSSVSVLVYRQNINALNAAVGGFIGYLSMVAAFQSMNPSAPVLSDESAAIQGILIVAGGTAAGAVIGYTLNTDHEYRFKPPSKKTP